MSAELKELLARAYAEKESMTDANLVLKKELASLKGQHQSAETKVRALQAGLPASFGAWISALSPQLTASLPP